LSKKNLSLLGNDSLEMALKQLVASDNETLSTCLAADQKRLNQRFAYLAFMFSTNGKDKVPSWFAKPNECDWTGITCTGNTVTQLNLFYKGLAGTIPDDVGLWTNLTYFGIYSFNNKLVGSLPSSIGLWTGLTYFGVADNQLTGTVPKQVANWTSIQSAYFHKNMLNGVMPVIGNKFCPKNGTGGDLVADCGEIVCGCCSECCCDSCPFCELQRE
jgi:Leucine-rich repeat (LRR) protein